MLWLYYNHVVIFKKYVRWKTPVFNRNVGRVESCIDAVSSVSVLKSALNSNKHLFILCHFLPDQCIWPNTRQSWKITYLLESKMDRRLTSNFCYRHKFITIYDLQFLSLYSGNKEKMPSHLNRIHGEIFFFYLFSVPGKAMVFLFNLLFSFNGNQVM